MAKSPEIPFYYKKRREMVSSITKKVYEVMRTTETPLVFLRFLPWRTVTFQGFDYSPQQVEPLEDQGQPFFFQPFGDNGVVHKPRWCAALSLLYIGRSRLVLQPQCAHHNYQNEDE